MILDEIVKMKEKGERERFSMHISSLFKCGFINCEELIALFLIDRLFQAFISYH